ncbi:hypothetical protein [Burkholderia alba]|uniref:hypothetical protein n=1 Tax=Burkholderia alba TaxID=2683677 RepID=UPI002B05A400|nr:hypothetical protein [Burkholderia alba]
MSTLDKFGDGYVLQAGPSASVRSSSRSCLNPDTPAVLAAGKNFDSIEAGMDGDALTGPTEDGEVLIRPEGFVLRRSDERA